ncbi:type 1 glutamine amidotransferase family protein [Lysinibacillus sp.]|uniref:type 1 glutamine amidotransferase family protein n=1 Tax=Lysinibacillus sp. TaxID=1869345 RepID=UPI0028AB0F6A|nr:type 1 glutamine amidotransferase family protein [Lysinibacillus sp.]
MQTRKVYLYVFDTMADWEIGYLMAELNSGRYFKKGLEPLEVMTIGIDRSPVTTMGGITILPTITIVECHLNRMDLLILPGGNTWLESIHDPMLHMVSKALNEEVFVAAICGATIGLAKAGLLDTRQHTSNDLEYLKMLCPQYIGDEHFNQEPAVTERNLVTASGIAPLEFAYHVLRQLDVFTTETLHAWYKLYETREKSYFYELMTSIE